MRSALVNVPNTDGSLLLELQSQSPARREAAWPRFESIYRPLILAWCQRRLKPEAAEDLAQDVLLKLSLKFPQMCYNPDRGRFHSWLKATVENALTDYARRQGRQVADAVGGTDNGRMLAYLAGPEADELSSAISNHPVTGAVQALARAQAQVPEAHWKAFCFYHREKRPVEEIAAELGLGVANVYKILQRTRKLVKEGMGHE
jgi:RNA polymerase sigma factor (sigma-70 family)